MGVDDGLYGVDLLRVNPSWLSWETARDGVDLERLPKTFVQDPASLEAGAAVVSWRWDRGHYSGRSRNVALALLHAQRMGLRVLFLDYVSVDQSLPIPELLRKVMALERLFSRMPVIAAYDEPAKDMREWSNTLRRPWILFEARIYSTNQTEVTHVGFRPSGDDRRHLSFENELYLIRRSGFAGVILDIMHGRVGMANIADFALILPEFEVVFSAAIKSMSRNDYLLTAFLLAAKYEPGQVVERGNETVNYGFRTNVGSLDFDTTEFVRYAVGPPGGTERAYEWQREILFDGEPVAVWRTKMTSSFDRNWIDVLPSAEQRILERLGLSEETLFQYSKRDQQRKASLFVDRTAPPPKVREEVALIDDGDWATEVPSPQATTLGFSPGRWD